MARRGPERRDGRKQAMAAPLRTTPRASARGSVVGLVILAPLVARRASGGPEAEPPDHGPRVPAWWMERRRAVVRTRRRRSYRLPGGRGGGGTRASRVGGRCPSRPPAGEGIVPR